jgi:primary-amine oxidase
MEARSHPQVLLAVLLSCLPLAAHGAARHPLDALEASEITATTAILKSAGQVDDQTLIASITLEEPPKAEVLAWKPGDAIPRRAKTVLRHRSITAEAVVDLGSGKVTSLTEIPGAQPFVTLPEVLSAIAITTADPRMQEGLRKRGITDFEKLFCAPRTVGNFGAETERTKRIVKVDCFDIRDVRTDVFAKPIEGLFATVDLDRRSVIDVTDLGVVPIPGGNSELDPASVGTQRDARPVVQSAPAGGNVTMDGSMVHWQKWSFHVRWGIREGVIVSLVRYQDGDRSRSVLYEGHLSEIFVPYQDPTEGWYYRNYMDAGDYGFGTFASPLVPGADCPASALFLSPVMSNVAGGADVQDKRICIFELAPGEPAWRHFDFITQALESRPATELVVRYIATVGNYDYVLDWVFDQKGNITYRAGATGIDSVKGVTAQSLEDPTAAEDTAYGPLIAPGRVGINHDHFLSLRLDLDVDGTSNMFARTLLEAEKLPPQAHRRTSIWTTREVPAKTDSEAKFRLSYEHPAMWHVMNMARKNATGYPVGYMIHPRGNALMLMDPADPAFSRAQFANYHLWVTPYAPDERYAAGDYPNQSEPGQGLPAWTSHARDIVNQDLVLWYTMGFHHVPSSEDWPVYSLGWHAVTLAPYNFFDRNPALDVPPVAAGADAPVRP